MGATAQRLQDMKRSVRRTGKSSIAAFQIEFDSSPLNDAIKKLNSASEVNAVQVLEERIVPKVMQFLTNEVKSRTPIDLGHLHDAISYKIVRYDSTGVVVGIVGVDPKYFDTVTRISRKDLEEKTAERADRKRGIKIGDVLRKERKVGQPYQAKIRPGKYFHLVELGHALKGGKGVQPATHFFQNAIDANREHASEIFVSEIESVLLEAVQ